MEGLESVVEPETGLPAVKLGLIRIGEDGVIYYRPISAYTPQILVIALGIEILIQTRRKVKVEGYYLEEEINRRLEELYEAIGGNAV